MKKLLVGALALLALTACNKDCKDAALQQEAMQFGSNIPALNLRMAGNAFEANDAIGISMTGDATATNVEYKTTAGGATATFAPAATGLTFAEGQTVNFVSYYPYSANATTDLAIDLTNAQTDVLYSNNLTGIKTAKDATGANHVLQFTHKLALVSFTMTGLPAGTTITSAQLEGIVTTSSMKIADGTLTNGTATATQKLQIAAGAFAPTIVIPATNANAKLVIKLSDGKSYSYTFPSLALQSGKNHKFNVTLASGAITVDQVNGQISDWDVVDGDDITVNPDGGTEPTPEPEPEPQPTTGELLFPGANFEDFAAFKGTLNTRFGGLQAYATEATGAGRNGSTALHINGTPKGNDYVFTVQNKAGKDFTGKTKISFYIKGTAAGKSISCNVYTGGRNYKAFNIGDVNNADVNVSVAANNQYAGSITANDWVKVTLDITGLTLPTSGDLFAFKVGKEVAWDLYVDDITIE
ncbi:MAG: fimbrillin family protein [Porphyromonas sp.]|uniref:fimbrillin family protein n=1 Tax=Porphyromonas sp. TaxID=1924944 RepID=UPI001A3EC43C|nr:fimbrillin family protein [Porphyromonas sp.]MBL6452881.1 fimbrillin family protein [Porphyromonas sp.]